MKTEIINQISTDLKIKTYEGEPVYEYHSRILYTALAQWMRYSILDKTNNDMNGNIKSKKYILRRGMGILDNFISLYPMCYKYFYPEDGKGIPKKRPIEELRKKMLNCGELLEINPKGYVTLPTNYQKPIFSGITREYGINNDASSLYIGVTKIIKETERKFIDLNIVDPNDYLNWLNSKSNWEVYKNPDDFSVFNPRLKRIPSNSWVKYVDYHIINDKVLLARRESRLNGMKFDYFLLKKDEAGNTYISRLNSILCDWKEERRIILALRNQLNNNIEAVVRDFGAVKILRLYTRLPLKEEIILDTFCWPRKDIFNKIEYTVSIEIWEYINEILKSINIVIKEDTK